jgi:hypothetical protein
VAVGPTGSGTPFTVALVLRAFGVPQEGVRMVAAPFGKGRRCSAPARSTRCS